MRKLQDASNPIAGKDACPKNIEKFAKLVAILGPGLKPTFGSSFATRSFKSYLKGLKRGPKLVPKLDPKPEPKIATNFANFFNIFRACSKSLPAMGLPASSFAFFRARPCLRSATTDHLKLPWGKSKW